MAQVISIEEGRITVNGGLTFGCVHMPDFLAALAKELKPNSFAYDMFSRMNPPAPKALPVIAGAWLARCVVACHRFRVMGGLAGLSMKL